MSGAAGPNQVVKKASSMALALELTSSSQTWTPRSCSLRSRARPSQPQIKIQRTSLVSNPQVSLTLWQQDWMTTRSLSQGLSIETEARPRPSCSTESKMAVIGLQIWNKEILWPKQCTQLRPLPLAGMWHPVTVWAHLIHWKCRLTNFKGHMTSLSTNARASLLQTKNWNQRWNQTKKNSSATSKTWKRSWTKGGATTKMAPCKSTN